MNITEAGQCGSCSVISYRFSRNALWPTSVDFRPVSSGVGEGGWFESVWNLYERGGGRSVRIKFFLFGNIFGWISWNLVEFIYFEILWGMENCCFFRDIFRVRARWQATVIVETWWVIGLLHLSVITGLFYCVWESVLFYLSRHNCLIFYLPGLFFIPVSILLIVQRIYPTDTISICRHCS